MISQAVDPHHYIRTARHIRAQIPVLLSQWGLVAKFNRWRLAQDPKSGMVILFGVLDNKYIATHTTTPFTNYFDPQLLRDLETELQVQIISSSNDGLRYAFILERGQIDEIPKHIDLQADEDKLIVRVLFSEKPVVAVMKAQNAPALISNPEDEDTQNDRSVGSYLQVFKEIKFKAEASKSQPV
jgi:hypothetical protein